MTARGNTPRDEYYSSTRVLVKYQCLILQEVGFSFLKDARA